MPRFERPATIFSDATVLPGFRLASAFLLVVFLLIFIIVVFVTAE